MRPKQQILAILKRKGDGLSITEIERESKYERHTLAKYLHENGYELLVLGQIALWSQDEDLLSGEAEEVERRYQP